MQTISRRFTAEKSSLPFDEEITDGRSLQANRTVRCVDGSFDEVIALGDRSVR